MKRKPLFFARAAPPPRPPPLTWWSWLIHAAAPEAPSLPCSPPRPVTLGLCAHVMPTDQPQERKCLSPHGGQAFLPRKKPWLRKRQKPGGPTLPGFKGAPCPLLCPMPHPAASPAPQQPNKLFSQPQASESLDQSGQEPPSAPQLPLNLWCVASDFSFQGPRVFNV